MIGPDDQQKEPIIIGKIDPRLSLDPVLSSDFENVVVEPEVFESVGELEEVIDYGLSEDDYTKPTSELDNNSLQFQNALEAVQSLHHSQVQVKDEDVNDMYRRLEHEFEELKKLLKDDQAKKSKVDEMLSELDEFSIAGQLRSKEFNFLKDSIDTTTSTRYNVTFKSLDARNMQYTRELETRVAKLEKLVGIPNLDSLEISEQRVFKDYGTISSILSKLNLSYETLLKPDQLELTRKGLKQSKKELEEFMLAKRKMKLEGFDSTDDQKLLFLYGEMKKLLPVAESLPQLVGRLRTLDEIHLDSKMYIEQSKLLVEEQKSLQSIASNIQEGLKSIRDAVSASQKVFDENIKKLSKI